MNGSGSKKLKQLSGNKYVKILYRTVMRLSLLAGELDSDHHHAIRLLINQLYASSVTDFSYEYRNAHH